jgi:uncharacterized membrane protein
MLLLARTSLLASVAATALIAGFFYAYGSSVLPGLDELPRGDAVRSMQAINGRVRNWMFAPSFFGSLALPAGAFAAFAYERRWSVCAWLALGLAL